MPLPVGTWNISANGQVGTLVTASLELTGINGTLRGQPFMGFFDEAAQELRLMRVTSADVATFEVYRGTLFLFSPATGTLVNTLAGTFMAFPSVGAAHVLGWSAQMHVNTKNIKDTGDTKFEKDQKDFKDIKELDTLTAKGSTETPPTKGLTDTLPVIAQLAMRMNAVEQLLAVGRSFIAPAERPAVGVQVSGDKPPVDSAPRPCR